jgi:hypothetical protein
MKSNLLIKFAFRDFLFQLGVERTAMEWGEEDNYGGTGELREAGQKKAQITFPLRHFFPLKIVK